MQVKTTKTIKIRSSQNQSNKSTNKEAVRNGQVAVSIISVYKILLQQIIPTELDEASVVSRFLIFTVTSRDRLPKTPLDTLATFPMPPR